MPAESLDAELYGLLSRIRARKSFIQELRGDLNKANREILYAMRFLAVLSAAEKETPKDNEVHKMRGHPDMKIWMMLRKRMVTILVKQGRLKAAESNIDAGLHECKMACDSLSRVEFLSQRTRVEVLTGRILEIHKDRRIGAVPTAERCLALANKALPIPTVHAVQSRLMLYTILEQNPSLMTSIQFGKAPSVISDQSAQAKAEEAMGDTVLDAQAQVNISPIAKDLQMREAGSKKKGKSPIATMDNP